MQRIGHALALVALATGSPAAAQDSDDWDFGEDPARKLAIAAVTFDNFGVAVRCMDGNLSVVMSGLPAASGVRSLRYRMGESPEGLSSWVSGRDSTSAFAVWPRFVATQMSRGGRLAVAAADGERVRRFAVDLPRSSQSIGRVFQACGHELNPPDRDAPPGADDLAGLIWVRQPEISFPSQARYEGGQAAVLCNVTASGGLRGCTAESEFPEGSGFGRAAVIGAHRSGRVGLAEGSDSSMENRRISFVTRYWTDDTPVTPPPSRLPGREDAYDPPRPNED